MFLSMNSVLQWIEKNIVWGHTANRINIDCWHNFNY